VVVLLGLASSLPATLGQSRRSWCASKGGLVAFYTGLVLAFVDAAAIWIAGAGAVWFVAGRCVRAGGHIARGPAIGEFLESALRSPSTLSFLRVGAFALATAGVLPSGQPQHRRRARSLAILITVTPS
jgi:vacuolar-type H+-ATPase subunit I/STV1